MRPCADTDRFFQCSWCTRSSEVETAFFAFDADGPVCGSLALGGSFGLLAVTVFIAQHVESVGVVGWVFTFGAIALMLAVYSVRWRLTIERHHGGRASPSPYR